MAIMGHRIISGHSLAFDFCLRHKECDAHSQHCKSETEQGAILLLTRIPTFVL